MLNRRSNHLVVLVATHNRIDLLKRSLASVLDGTKCSHEVIVIDGGSTDGTVDYLKSRPDVTPVFQAELLGTARAYNEVWRQIESKYTCWLSDDTEMLPGSLDLAVGILEAHPEIGMVGLKMKDTAGPWKTEPYKGALSAYGILNCNHGVLPTDLLRSVGYFNEGYRSYTIDPDLTASVLCAGRRVVMTKRVCLLHHRSWAEHEDVQVKVKRETAGIDNKAIYGEKFKFLKTSKTLVARAQARLGVYVGRILFNGSKPESRRLGVNRRDWRNITRGRFIRLTDPLANIPHPYHLTQKIPSRLLMSKTNPYIDLVTTTGRDR